VIRTYKYRLYPTNTQDRALDFLLWQGRTVYNAALEQRITADKERGESLTYAQQWAHFRDLRHTLPDTLGKLNATAIQQLLRRLDKAFTAFFRRLKAGQTPGFPRFKSRDRFHSLEFKHGDGCKLRRGDRALFYVQNVGEVKVKYHRPLPDNATIKHVVVKRSNRKWDVCLQLETPDMPPRLHTGEAVGIDAGLLRLLTLSDETAYENPRWLRASLAKLRKAQRRLARRVKGSNRRRKAAAIVASLHEHVANQRADFWHKTTRQLVNTYNFIGIEDLTLGFMTRNEHLSLSAHDAGLGMFRQLLTYKAEEAGTSLAAVNPQYTSQVCSGCGVIVPKELSVRTHDCPHCGLSVDRDVNAARIILFLALSEASLHTSAGTEPSGANAVPLSPSPEGDKSIRSLRSPRL
jgi:putative transposase